MLRDTFFVPEPTIWSAAIHRRFQHTRAVTKSHDAAIHCRQHLPSSKQSQSDNKLPHSTSALIPPATRLPSPSPTTDHQPLHPRPFRPPNPFPTTPRLPIFRPSQKKTPPKKGTSFMSESEQMCAYHIDRFQSPSNPGTSLFQLAELRTDVP
jgi:hypothetical protein